MFFNVATENLYTANGLEIKQALTEKGSQDFKYLDS